MVFENVLMEASTSQAIRISSEPMKQPHWQDFEAIIFDCDGTLTDSMPVHFVAWSRTMRRYGIDFPVKRFYSLGGVPSDKIIRMLADEQDIEIDSDLAATEKETAFLELIDLLVPIEPVMEIVLSARGTMPIAVASGGFREIILRQLKQLGCEGWFNAIVTAEDTPRHKPHPDVFLEAARRLGVAPEKCLVYEDADLGIQAATAAGMTSVDVRMFHTPRVLSID